MAARKTKTIDEVNNMKTMVRLMDAFDVSCEGMQTMDEMKTIVKEKSNQSQDKAKWIACQAFSVLSEAKDEDVKKKEVLSKFYSEVEKCMNRMDDKFITLLDNYMGNVKKTMKIHQAQLQQREYFILVAGETSAGKSSLVNLILGEELLSYSALCTTTTICELRYGRERRIVAHFIDKDPETGLPTKTIPLVESQEGSPESSYLKQISPFVELKKGSIYKKIEIFWPHQLLEKGVVIIDSPGVGESEDMDKIVIQYLPKAFAFIYVINSSNAGGVQRGKLKMLLEALRQQTVESQDQFPSKCALFVCNKWDQIDENDKETVQKEVINKLEDCWDDLVPESQIVYISTTEAIFARDYGIITEDFLSLMSYLKSMILKSIEARLEIHWNWLFYLLSRTCYQAKVFATILPKCRGELASEVLLRLELIEKNQVDVMLEFQKDLSRCINDATKKLSDYLKSDDVRAFFASWTLSEVPQETTFLKAESNIKKALQSRLQDIIHHWEEENQVLTNARKSLLQRLQNDYTCFQGQLGNVQQAITGALIPKSGSHFAEIVLGAGAAIPIWCAYAYAWYACWAYVPPILYVSSVCSVAFGVFGAFAIALQDRRIVREYEKDKCAFMSKMAISYLDAFTKMSQSAMPTLLKYPQSLSVANVVPFVRDQFEEVESRLLKMKTRIPEMIKAEKVLLEQLKNEFPKEVCQPILNEACEISDRLAVFGLTEARAVDISSEELEWTEDLSSFLGSGAFASVYHGKMKRHGEVHSVALKVSKEFLDARNASLIVTEVNLLRGLGHPYIVTFHGTSLFKKDGKTKVILVMEKCKGNLKNHIFDNPDIVPAKSKSAAAAKEACRWAMEITAALAFIHGKGVVHRDLKLENILLSVENTAKITDVGLSKTQQEITGTVAGTPVYMAPEVIRSEFYDNKADIYSFGILLWEMWYGQRAFGEYLSIALTRQDLFSYILDGYRPRRIEGCKAPPSSWNALMKECWNGDPKKRRSAEWCKEETIKIYSQAKELL